MLPHLDSGQEERAIVSAKGNGKCIKVALLNTRSVCNKTEAIQELVADNSLSIMCLTETWLRDGDSSLIGELCPPSHYFIGASHPISKGKSGGGVGCILAPSPTAIEMSKGSIGPLNMSLSR